jgi:A/G-specific adenine glycosylase
MEHGGRFPEDHDSLLGLKGVGDYTAAAIGSIAFGIAEPVVDGNVYRVLARVFGISTPIDSTAGRKEFRALASRLLDRSRPGEHNQAVMELGATVCTPLSPQCSECPMARKCVARATDRIAQLPVKAGKATVRTRYFNYLHIGSGTTLFLQKRSGRDVWQGLWELPLIESPAQLTRTGLQRSCNTELGGRWEVLDSTEPVKHVLSHQRIMATFWRVRPPSQFTPPVEWHAVKDPARSGHAVPRLVERYLLEHLGTKAPRR